MKFKYKEGDRVIISHTEYVVNHIDELGCLILKKPVYMCTNVKCDTCFDVFTEDQMKLIE